MQHIQRFVRRFRRHIRRNQMKRRNRPIKAHRAQLYPEALKTIAETQLTDGLNRAPRATKIILSMASYPGRFPTLAIVLKRLLDQTLKPDRLILWLDDYISPTDVPEDVTSLTRHGLEIRYCPYDLKPHKKYFFAMQEFPDDLVITVDDDIIYPRNLVETLEASWRRFPDCVSAIRAHKITFDWRGQIKPYSSWKWECRTLNRPSMRFMATGCGGTLYPPHVIPPEAFDLQAIRETSLNADDLWLKFMQMRTGTRVVICGLQALMDSIEIDCNQQTALRIDNLSRGGNDRCIALLMAREGRTIRDFRR